MSKSEKLAHDIALNLRDFSPRPPVFQDRQMASPLGFFWWATLLDHDAKDLFIILDDAPEGVSAFWTPCSSLQRIHDVLQSIIDIVKVEGVSAEV
jgi:hypothetical protein